MPGHDITIFTMKNGRDARTKELIHAPLVLLFAGIPRKTAYFEDQRYIVIVKNHYLSIRRVAVIVISQPSARTEDAWRKMTLTKHPSSNIHLVDTLITEISITGIEIPVPVVMQIPPRQRLHRSRTDPEVVVDVIRNNLLTVHLADASTWFVADPTSRLDRSEISVSSPLDRRFIGPAGTVLRTGLNHAPMTASRFNHGTPFMEIVTDGLLDIDILAGFTGPDRLQGMPVIGRGQRDGMQVITFQQSSEIDLRIDFSVISLVEVLGSIRQDLLIHVAQGDDLHPIKLLQRVVVITTTTTQTHDRDTYLVGSAWKTTSLGCMRKNRPRHGQC